MTLDFVLRRPIFRATMKFSIISLLFIGIGVSALSSCLPLAAGAAAGYVAHEEGYRVRNPITQTDE